MMWKLNERDHLEDRRRWDNNIKIHLKEMRWNGVNWIHLAQDRGKRRDLMNTISFKRRNNQYIVQQMHFMI